MYYSEVVRYITGVQNTFKEYGGRQLCNYLMKTYGLNSFSNLYKTRDWSKVYDKSLDEMIIEFDNYLDNKFAKYVKLMITDKMHKFI